MNAFLLLFLHSTALTVGQGGTSMGMLQSPDALLYNPALIARNISASVSYAYPYGLSGLRSLNFGVAYRGISVAGAQFAVEDLYSEELVLAGYRRKFFRKLDIGLGVGIHSFFIDGYAREIVGVTTGGVRYRFGPVYLGGNFFAHTTKSVSFLSGSGNKLSNRFEVGFSLNKPSGVNWTFEGEPGKSLRAGVEVGFTEGFKIRMGIFNKRQFTIGAGLSGKNWAFDFATLEHRELGTSYFFTLKFNR